MARVQLVFTEQLLRFYHCTCTRFFFKLVLGVQEIENFHSVDWKF
jgi:hypothetical protein